MQFSEELARTDAAPVMVWDECVFDSTKHGPLLRLTWAYFIYVVPYHCSGLCAGSIFANLAFFLLGYYIRIS